MSDTPETDVSCGYALSSHYGRLEGSYLQMDWSGPFVHAEVARKLERERDEAIRQRNETNESSVFSCNFYYEEKLKAERERDEARAKLSRKQQTLTIAEGTISDLRKQRDEWSAMCSRYKQERDIAEQDATNYHARIIELIAERDKTKQERDEAQEKYDKLATEHMLAVNKLCEERDEAREQVNRYRYNLDLLPIKWDI